MLQYPTDLRRSVTFSILVFCILLVASCDTAPGPSTPDGTPPTLSEFSFSPSVINFESLPPTQVESDSLARVPLTLSVKVLDRENDIDSVLFIVRSPFDPLTPVLQGRLTPGEVIGTYTGTGTIILPKGNIGRYTVLAYAIDREGQLSNQVLGILSFESGPGSPPVIESIEGPDTISPPLTLVLIAVVSDPDGLGNIQDVFVTTPNGNSLKMFDDGESLGDDVANDGRYTASFDVPTATPGTFTFSFKAVDRSGLESEVVIKEIIVQ